MAGIKGRSGRKTWDKELATKELWDLSVIVLKKALTCTDGTITEAKKAEIATALISKMIPQENKHSGDMQILLNYGHRIKSDTSAVRTEEQSA